MIITIDGPAGSGKSTIARLLSHRIHADFLDTGSMYRAVTLCAVQNEIDLNDEDAVLDMMDRTDFSFTVSENGMRVSVNGSDASAAIRDPDITRSVRHIAAAPGVRARLVEMQRDIASQSHLIVTEGRDQGTVAFPDAEYKFYLTAGLRERAHRRRQELIGQGKDMPLDSVIDQIRSRDESDQNRTVGPLRPAPDAVHVDTTGLTIDEVLAVILKQLPAEVYQ